VRLARFLWNSPNTLLGLAFALLAAPLGVRFRKGAGTLDVLSHPLVLRGCAITLGVVVCYGPGAAPERPLKNGHSFADHERQHVRQGERLGPFYLPLHLATGVWAMLRDGRWHGPANRLEAGPLASPPRPWA